MLIGIIFLVIGVLYLFEIIVPGFSVNYGIVWPILLIVGGLYYTFKQKRIDTTNSIILFIGVWWLLVNLDLIAGEYRRIFAPLFLIIIGVSIILNTVKVAQKLQSFAVKGKDGILNYYGIFSGCKEKVKSKDFNGAVIYSIFGGCELDFSEIEMKNDSEILIYSIFGGSDITLPEDYNVVFNSTGIFGGNENRNKNDYKKTRKTLTITCISVFGGTDVK